MLSLRVMLINMIFIQTMSSPSFPQHFKCICQRAPFLLLGSRLCRCTDVLAVIILYLSLTVSTVSTISTIGSCQ